MLLHDHGHHKIAIRTSDTDVVVLAISVAQTLGSEYELWLAFGTGKHFQYLAAHEMATGIGPRKAKHFQVSRTNSCDTVSSFVLGMERR